MVAVVSGSGLGLFDSSLNILGNAGAWGQRGLGRGPGAGFVNAATGNLVLQFNDETLSGIGLDLFATRTYNSQGANTGGDGNRWRSDGERTLYLVGARLGAGSKLYRTGGDGHVTIYTCNTATQSYQSSEGDGADDTVVWDSAASQWVWTEGSSRVSETYSGDGTFMSPGKLQKQTDASGNAITFSYNSDGLLEKVVDSGSGQELNYSYSLQMVNAVPVYRLQSLSTRLSATGQLTKQVEYTYDNGRLSTVKTDLTPNNVNDNLSFTTTYTYDGSSDRIASVKHSDGSEVALTWVEDQPGVWKVQTLNDAGGLKTFTYDNTNRRTTMADGLGKVWVFVYDTKGRLYSTESPALGSSSAITTDYRYTTRSDVLSITDGRGYKTRYEYDANGNRIFEMDALGNTVRRSFDATTNQLLIENRYRTPDADALGGYADATPGSVATTRYVYDSKARLRFTISAEGRVTEYGYDTGGRGLLVRQIQYSSALYDLSGLTESSTLDLGTLTSWTSGRELALTTFDYDGLGNLQRRSEFTETNADGSGKQTDATRITEYTYSEHGQLLQSVAVHGSSATPRTTLTSYSYDGLGRVLTAVNGAVSTTTVYQDSGAAISVSDTAGLTEVSNFDNRGRLISSSRSGSGSTRVTRYYYNAAGQLRMSEAPDGTRDYLFYDEAGRVIYKVNAASTQAVNGSGAVIADGAMTPGGEVTGYVYNKDNLVITETHYALRITTTGWFNSNTGVVAKAALTILAPTASGSADLRTDADDRITTYSYDAADRLTFSKDVDSGVGSNQTYDGMGHLLSRIEDSQLSDAKQQRITRYFYDRDGLQVGVVDALGYLTETRYDAAGRVVTTIRYATPVTNATQQGQDGTPIWTGLSAFNIEANSELNLNLPPAYDPEGRDVLYSIPAQTPGGQANTVPAGLIFDATTCTFSGHTNAAAGTQFVVYVRAQSTASATDFTDRKITFTVTAEKQAPQWQTIPDQQWDIGVNRTISLAGLAADPENGTLSYKLLSSLPPGLSFTTSTQVLSGTPTKSGTYRITLRATDSTGLYTDSSFVVTVKSAVSAPVWPALSNVSAYQTEYVEYRLPEAWDADGQKISYSVDLSRLPLNWTAANWNKDTRTLSGYISKDQAVTNGVNTMPLTISVTATDSAGNSSIATFTMSFLANRPPEYNGGLDDFVSKEGTKFQGGAVVDDAKIYKQIPLSAFSDPEGAGLTYSVVAQPGQPWLSILSFDQTTRTLSGSAHSTTYEGKWYLRVIATDSKGLAAWKDITLTVQFVIEVKGTNSTKPAAPVNSPVHPTVLNGAGVVDNSDALAGWIPAVSSADRYSYHYYDAQGRETGRVDENGAVSEVSYDEAHNTRTTSRYQTAVVVAAGENFAAIRARAGSKLGNGAVEQYDGLGRLSLQTAEDGSVTHYQYDATSGLLTSQVTAEGSNDARITRWRYDAFRELTGELGGVGSDKLATTSGMTLDTAITSYGLSHSYDSAGRRIKTTDANNHSTYYYYDDAGRLSQTINAAGEVRETVYNSFGQVKQTIAWATRLSAGVLASLTGGSGRVAVTADATDDVIESFDYTNQGQLASHIDGEGVKTSYVWNDFGELDSRTETIGTGKTVRHQYAYDKRGTLLAQIDDVYGLAAATQWRYDAFGRVIASLDAADQRTVTTYSDQGRTIVVNDPLHKDHRTEYDVFGRVTKQFDAMGSAPTTFSYDVVNRSTTVTTPEGVSVTTVKNRQGDTLTVTDGNGGVTTYSYDKDGHLDTVKDALQNTISDNVYDNSGRLSTVTDARGTVTLLEYDAANRVMRRTVDVGTGKLNLKTLYVFDAMGQQFTVTEGEGTTSARTTQYDYDRKGQLKCVTVDPSGLALTTTYTYDGVGNQLTVARGTTASPSQYVTTYTFDKLNRRIKEELPLGIVTQYRYNANGQVSRRIDANGNSTWYIYDAAGRQTYSVDALGEVTQNNYDDNGRLIQVRQYYSPVLTNALGDQIDAGDLFLSSDPATHLATTSSDLVNRMVYDHDGHLRFSTDAMGYVNESVFDDNGNVISSRRYDQPIALTVPSTPDAVVAKLAAVNAGSIATNYIYDTNNRLRFSIDALGYVSESIYDAAGQVSETRRYDRAINPEAIATPDDVLRALEATQQWSFSGANALVGINSTQVNNSASANVITTKNDALVFTTANTPTATTPSILGNTTYAQSAQVRLRAEVEIGADSTQRYFLVGLDSTGTAASYRRLMAYFKGGSSGKTTLYVNYADSAGVTHSVSEGTLKSNTRYIVEVETLSDRVMLYVYEKGKDRSTGFNYTDMRNDYGSVRLRAYGHGDSNGDNSITTLHSLSLSTAATATPGKIQTRYFYDAAGRLRYSVDAKNQVSETIYNVLSQSIKTVQYATTITPASWTLSDVEAVLNRSDVNNRSNETVYDKAGRARFHIDAQGRLSESVYDAMSRVTEQRQFDESVPAVGGTARIESELALLRGSHVVTDGFTRGEKYSYDSAGRLKTVTDAAGFVEMNQYDALGNRIVFINKRGDNWLYQYDALGRLTKEWTPPVAIQLSNETDAVAGRQLVTMTKYDAFGRVSERHEGRVCAVGSTTEITTDERITIYGYDKLGHQTSIIYPGWYDTKDFTVYPTQTEKRRNGSLPGNLDRLQRTTETGYDAYGNAVFNKVRIGAGNTLDNDFVLDYKVYDALGRVTHDIDALGQVTAYGYDNFGNQNTVTRRFNTVSSTTLANAFNANTGLTANDLASVAADASDRIVTSFFDSLGRKTSVLQNIGTNHFDATTQAFYSNTAPETVYEYNAFNEVITEKVRQNNGAGSSAWAETWHWFDTLGRERVTVDAQGYATERVFDALGNVTQTIEYASAPSNRSALARSGVPDTSSWSVANDGTRRTKIDYNALNQRKAVTRLNASWSSWNGMAFVQNSGDLQEWIGSYDAMGRLTSRTDVLGNVSSSVFDALGHVVTAIEPSRTVAAYSTESTLTDSNPYSEVSTTGRFIRRDDPFINRVIATPITHFSYNAFGQIVTTTRDPGAGFGQRLTSNTVYDHAGNAILSTATHFDGTVDNAPTKQQFDVFGRIIKTTQDVSANYSAWTGMAGTNVGITTETIESRYVYDKVGRQIATLTVYTDTGDDLQLLAGDVRRMSGTRNLYNVFGEIREEQVVTGLATADEKTLRTSAASGFTVVTTASYSYDKNGRITRQISAEGTTNYYYDLLGRVTRQSQVGNGSDTARNTDTAYDMLGRSVTQYLPTFDANLNVFTTDAQTLTTVTPIVVQKYDAFGNVTERSEGGYKSGNTTVAATSTMHYVYDAENHLIAETSPEASAWGENGVERLATMTHAMYYDQGGRSIGESDAASWRKKDTSGNWVADGSGTLRNRRREYNQIGQVTREVDATNVYSDYVYDTQGNRIASRNAYGTVMVDSFDAAGNVIRHGVLRTAAGTLAYYSDNAISGTDDWGHTINGFSNETPVEVVLATKQYDAAGRQYASIDAAISAQEETRFSDGRIDKVGNVSYTVYDERGLVIATRNQSNVWKRSQFDQYGFKTKEIDALYNTNADVLTHNVGVSWDYAIDSVDLNIDANQDGIKDYHFGQLMTLTDMAGRQTCYQYNGFGQVSGESYVDSDGTLIGEHRTNSYLNNGALSQIRDAVDGTTYFQSSQYNYDNMGRRVREQNDANHDWVEYLSGHDHTVTVHHHSESHREEHLGYDLLGRLARVEAPQGAIVEKDGTSTTNSTTATISELSYAYDELGNRRHIHLEYWRPGAASASDPIESWYTYDAEGRITLSQGRLYQYYSDNEARIYISHSADQYLPDMKARGAALRYDLAGRRVVSLAFKGAYARSPAVDYTQQRYDYDDLGHLVGISQKTVSGNGMTRDPVTGSGRYLSTSTRTYDDRGYEISTTDYGVDGVSIKTRMSNSYRGDGQMRKQETFDQNGNTTQTVDYGDKIFSITDPLRQGFDAAGNLLGYNVTFSDGSTEKFTNSYALYNGYRMDTETVHYSSGKDDGHTHHHYDWKGNELSVSEDGGDVYSRVLTLNREGHILRKVEGGNAQDYYFNSEGDPIASVGTITSAEFDYNYTPVSSQYPSATPGHYVVNNGDTLAGIAQLAFGDASLWYQIADANSLSLGASDVLTNQVGLSLTLPNVITNIHNNSETFKPYNPVDMIGDTTPNPKLPEPPKHRCQETVKVLSTIIGVVVGVIVGIIAFIFSGFNPYVGGLAGGAAGAYSKADSQQWLQSMADGDFDWGAFATQGNQVTNWHGLQRGMLSGDLMYTLKSARIRNDRGTVGRSAVSPFAAGVGDTYDWKSTLISTAVGAAAGVTGGIGGLGGAVLAAAAGYTASYQLNKLAGRDPTWRNRDLLASIAEAAVTYGLRQGAGSTSPQPAGTQSASPVIGETPTWTEIATDIVTNTAINFVGAAVAYEVRQEGGSKEKWDGKDALLDAFGNAVGSNIGSNIGNKIKYQALPEKVKDLMIKDKAAGDRYYAMAKRFNINGNDEKGRNLLIEADTLAVTDLTDPDTSKKISFDQRLELFGRMLAHTDISDTEFQDVIDTMAHYDHATIGKVTTRDENAPAETNDFSSHNDSAPAPEQRAAFGAKIIDQAMTGTGHLLQYVSENIESRPWLKWTLTGVDIMAGPAKWAIGQAIEHSPVGQAKDAVMEYVTEKIGGQFEAAGYNPDEVKAGAMGGLTVGTLIISGAAGLVATAKTWMPKLAGMFKGNSAKSLEVNGLRGIDVPGGCFVKGTLVYTDKGLVAIEQVRLGDKVLSQPESTGDLKYKAVLNTFTFENKAIYRVTLAKPNGESETILATPNHPFWVNDVGWTRADYLEIGHTVELTDRTIATVSAVEDTGTTQDVYNIEVEEFHTYYVGNIGVWVHNTQDCRFSYEKYKAELRKDMGKPSVENPELANLMDDLYRPGAKVGSGSTADAVRHELQTGEQVGGKTHITKANQYSKSLEDWLAKNPFAKPGDRAAAENVLRDMQDALRGQ